MDSSYKDEDIDLDGGVDSQDIGQAIHTAVFWVRGVLELAGPSQVEEEVLRKALENLNCVLASGGENGMDQFEEFEELEVLFNFFCQTNSVLLQRYILETMILMSKVLDEDVVFVKEEVLRRVGEIALTRSSPMLLRTTARKCLTMIGTPRIYSNMFSLEDMERLEEQCETNEEQIELLLCFKEYNWFFGNDEQLTMAIQMLQDPTKEIEFYQLILEFIQTIGDSEVPLKTLDEKSIRTILGFVFFEYTSGIAADALLSFTRRGNMLKVMKECCREYLTRAYQSTYIGMNFARFYVEIVEMESGVEFGRLLWYVIREGSYEEKEIGLEVSTKFFDRPFSGTSIMRGFVEEILNLFEPENERYVEKIMNILCGIIQTTPEGDENVELIKRFLRELDEEEFSRELYEIQHLLERRGCLNFLPRFEPPFEKD